MEANTNLLSKLNVIRLELSKDLEKGGKNDYSNYTYFQLKDFMPKAIKLCNENGLFTKFWIDKEKKEMPSKTTINYITNADGEVVGKTEQIEEQFIWVEYAFLEVTDIESGEVELFKKETASCALQAAQPIQNLGSKSTYMKRYMYIDVFEINENDKIEEETGKPIKVETPKTTKTTKPKVTTVVETPVVAPQPVAPEAPVQEVKTDELMSMQTKMELASTIKELGLDPRETILECAKELGTDVPLLKETDKDKIIEIVNKKAGR